MSDERRKKFQAVVRKHLAALAADLDDFEQTTHGRIAMPGGVEMVAADLVTTYRDPTGYNVSNLSQGLDAFLKDNQ